MDQWSCRQCRNKLLDINEKKTWLHVSSLRASPPRNMITHLGWQSRCFFFICGIDFPTSSPESRLCVFWRWKLEFLCTSAEGTTKYPQRLAQKEFVRDGKRNKMMTEYRDYVKNRKKRCNSHDGVLVFEGDLKSCRGAIWGRPIQKEIKTLGELMDTSCNFISSSPY